MKNLQKQLNIIARLRHRVKAPFAEGIAPGDAPCPQQDALYAPMGPVSYTHLDVYKRQVQERAAGVLAGRGRLSTGSTRYKKSLPSAGSTLTGLRGPLISMRTFSCLLYTSRCV